MQLLLSDAQLPGHDHPLLGVATSRQLEQRLQASLPDHALIERAGLALAKLALALAPQGRMIWLLCGPGNNGGDALIAARHLQEAGRRVQVRHIGASASAPPDARHALARALAAGVPIQPGPAEIPADCELVVDGLLGLGTDRPAAGALVEAIQHINARPAGVRALAVDLPSGLHAGTGACLGDAVRADHTLCLLSLKPGLFTAEGRSRCGTIWFDALGALPDAAGPPEALLSGLAALSTWQQRHARSPSSHKGRQGDVLVLGGASGMSGAVGLAGAAALAAGAGRVYLSPLDAQGTGLPRPELMLWRAERWDDVSAWQDLTLVCGCGGGSAVTQRLPALLRAARRLVLDADALNAVAAAPALRELLALRRARGQATLLTPHPLEAARLLDCDAAAIQHARLDAARRLALRFGATVVLKGSGSVIASPAPLPPRINASGGAALATAGTGDVLAGWLGGLWAQQAAQCHDSAAGSAEQALLELACAGVAWHGLAAQGWRGPLRAADLIERMARLHR